MRSGRGDAAGMRPTREEEAGNGFRRQRAPVTTTGPLPGSASNKRCGLKQHLPDGAQFLGR